MSLAELVRDFGGVCAPAARSDASRTDAAEVRDVKLDSRGVEAGDLYAALVGTRADGAQYVPDALARGASAVLATRPLEPLPVPLWIHPDARALVGRVAARLYGRPARDMFVAAVTGTNGKTTTAHWIAQLLAASGRRPALLGTVGNRLADGRWLEATHTTPDAPGLQRLLARHRALGGDAVAMEASSHALEQERLSGLDVDVAVFTNLSRDHLDHHGSLERYAEAKALLFHGLGEGAAALVNAADPASARMAAAAKARGARVATYWVEGAEGHIEHGAEPADRLRATGVTSDLEGTSLTLDGMGFLGVRIRLPLLGRFNVENALAAAGAALLSGASPSAIAGGLAAVLPPPGRLEPVPTGERGFRVLVDYAHTEAALRGVLSGLRRVLEASAAPGRLLVVFGCGGERDRGKRPEMGRAAAELADLAVLTSDNPRGEDPERILDEIEAGAAGRARVVREADRRRAIRLALEQARPGDLVLIAGKGHETTQTVAGIARPFDDRQVVLEELP